MVFQFLMFCLDSLSDVGGANELGVCEFHYRAAVRTCQGVVVKSIPDHFAPRKSSRPRLGLLRQNVARLLDLFAADANVDVYVPIEGCAKSMKHQDQSGPIAALSGPSQERILDRAEEGIEGLLAIHLDPVSKLLRYSKYEMLVGNVEDIAQGGLDPAVGCRLAAGRAKA